MGGGGGVGFGTVMFCVNHTPSQLGKSSNICKYGMISITTDVGFGRWHPHEILIIFFPQL